MIHIATVHFKTDKWIDIQLKYLQKNIKQPYRVYAFLSGDAAKHSDRFYYSSTEPIDDHATKLNILADIIYFAAESKDEPLIFLDGDAFPIAPLDDYIYQSLKEYPLAAIQRLENIGDIQPHPSFCLTTPDCWKTIKGDWKEGFEWKSTVGTSRTDTGGNLYAILKEKHVIWRKMCRSSQNPYHPVFFGIYENLIYHHGAGYRHPITLHDRLKSLKGLYYTKFFAQFLDILLNKVSLKNRYRIHRLLGINKKLFKQNQQISDKIFNEIKNSVNVLDFIKDIHTD